MQAGQLRRWYDLHPQKVLFAYIEEIKQVKNREKTEQLTRQEIRYNTYQYQ